MPLSDNIIAEKNKVATPSTWLILLEITLTDSTVFRLVRNREDVTYDGDVYTKFNFQMQPNVQASQGQIPTLELKVNNITKLIESKLQELDGAINSTVKITIINSDLLAENFADLEMNFDVVGCNVTSRWVSFILGSPSPLRQRFPLNKHLALYCGWRFEEVECSYDRKVVVGVTLSNPVSIEITDHDFEIDDKITLYTINGITGGIEGDYEVKADTDSDNFTIKTLAGVDVNGGDFGGAYTSGGEVGYTTCERTLTACRKRENETRFGGFAGMRSGGIKIA